MELTRLASAAARFSFRVRRQLLCLIAAELWHFRHDRAMVRMGGHAAHAKRIQARARGASARRRYQEQRAAAIRIQAVERGWATRSMHNLILEKEKAEREATREKGTSSTGSPSPSSSSGKRVSKWASAGGGVRASISAERAATAFRESALVQMTGKMLGIGGRGTFLGKKKTPGKKRRSR